MWTVFGPSRAVLGEGSKCFKISLESGWSSQRIPDNHPPSSNILDSKARRIFFAIALN